MRQTPASARSGMALILTLAAVVAAGGLALFLQARSVASVQSAKTALTIERLRAAAAAAAREAMMVLAADGDLTVDHPGEPWAQPREQEWTDGISILAVVEDANRFYNWNNIIWTNASQRTQQDVLLDLMTICGDFHPTERIEALMDFLDAADDGPYESRFYERLDEPYTPPNRILWSPEEVLWCHGFSAELFQPRADVVLSDFFSGELRALTTVLPAALDQPLKVNVNTADKNLLLAIVGPAYETPVQTLVALRQVQPFESLSLLQAAHPDLAGVLSDLLAVSSTHFQVRARAFLDGHHVAVMAWVHRDEKGDVHILQWLEEPGGT